MFLAKIWPELFSDPDLRICYLPEKKIGHPKLTARSDEKVWVRDIRRV
jgi:hypothetical protein